MKILKVKGQNLTSLGEFELDLTAPEFIQNGLFAITGPTGAGKSTLLDSICLGLYGRTPRYMGRGGVPFGLPNSDVKSRLSTNDPRNLLSHGAGLGMAEIEFLGESDKRYKARWTVRRAREQPTGTFQKVIYELYSLEAEIKDQKIIGYKEVAQSIDEGKKNTNSY